MGIARWRRQETTMTLAWIAQRRRLDAALFLTPHWRLTAWPRRAIGRIDGKDVSSGYG